jgi:hypothetical protein
MARILQITFAAALIWLLALPQPSGHDRSCNVLRHCHRKYHSTYRPCDLIQQYCVVA